MQASGYKTSYTQPPWHHSWQPRAPCIPAHSHPLHAQDLHSTACPPPKQKQTPHHGGPPLFSHNPAPVLVIGPPCQLPLITTTNTHPASAAPPPHILPSLCCCHSTAGLHWCSTTLTSSLVCASAGATPLLPHKPLPPGLLLPQCPPATGAACSQPVAPAEPWPR